MNDKNEREIGKWLGPGLVLLWVAFSAFYVFAPGYPFGFYTDIGINIATTAMIAHVTPSLADTASLASWQPWHDNAAFTYTPMLNYAIAWLLNVLFRDAIRTVKFIQVLQFTLAFAGTAWCYRTLFGRSHWQWLAALLYTLIPTTAIMIRTNNDFGWVVSLLPVSTASSILLLRRFGASALPLCALMATVATGLFATVYVLLVAFPLYLILCALAGCFRSGRTAAWGVLGLVPLALMMAYVILPTYFAAVYGWPNSREFELQSGAVLGLFSQTPGSVIAWIHQENVLTQARSEFNASGSLWFMVPAGLAVWALAIYAAWRNWRRAGVLFAIVAGFVLIVLSLGPNLPLLGSLIWTGIARVPVLDALRTPDRFILLPAMIAVLGAVWAVAYLFDDGSRRLRVAALVAVGVAVLGYGIADVREHVLSLQDPDQEMPGLHDVSQAVLQRGGRTVSYAFVRNGSIIDTSDSALYGLPAPTIAASWDLAGSYADGDLGLALLRRSNVRTVITSPAWVYDRPPSMTTDFALPVGQTAIASRVLQTKDGISVFAVRDPRDMVSVVVPLCVQAGPGVFDRMAGLPDFERVALVHGAHPGCAGTAYGNYDPRDASVPAAAIARWTGTQAFGDSDASAPSHAFEVGRFFLTAPWYRDSILGNTPVEKTPFVTNGDGSTSKHLTFDVKRAGRYSAYVHVLGIGTIQRVDAYGVAQAVAQHSPQSFRWLEFPLGPLTSQTHSVDFHFQREGARQGPFAVDGIYVAPSGSVQRAQMSNGPIVLSPAVFAPGDTTAAQLRGNWNLPLFLFPRPQAGTLTPTGQGVVLDAHSGVGYYQGSPAVNSDFPRMVVTIPWYDAPGRYQIHIAAWLPGSGSTLGVSTAHQNAVATFDPNAGVAPTDLFAKIDVARGGAIQIRTTAPEQTGQTAGTLLVLAGIAPIDSALSPTTSAPGSETWSVDARYPLSAYAALHSIAPIRSNPALAALQSEIVAAQRGKAAAWKELADGTLTPKDLSTRLKSLNTLIASLEGQRDAANASGAPGFAVRAGGMTAPAGTIVTMHVAPTVQTGEVIADVTTPATGQGTMTLRCGSASASKIVTAAQESVAVWRDAAQPCDLSIRYDAARFAINTISVSAAGTHMTGWGADQFFPSGTYRWRVAGGNIASLTIDGRAYPQNRPLAIAPGYHHLVLTGDSRFGEIAFTNQTFALPVPPAQHPVSQVSPIAWSSR
ncbi:MAG: hypothetical protein ACLQPV_08070, partial [Vulcanimicrobiaceae bacterium]